MRKRGRMGVRGGSEKENGKEDKKMRILHRPKNLSNRIRSIHPSGENEVASTGTGI